MSTNILPEGSPLIDFALTGNMENLVHAMLVEKLDLSTFDFRHAHVDADLPLIGLAAGKGSFRAMQILLDAGACPDTALLYASTKERVKDLLKRRANPKHVGADGSTALIRRCAALPGENAAEAIGPIEVLLGTLADVHAADPNGYQAIHHALVTPGDVRGYDRMNVVKLLLGRGADPAATTTDGTTVMDLAVRCGSAGVVDHLLSNGFDLGDSVSDPEVVRRLLEACSVKGKAKVIERVIRAAGADVLNALVGSDTFPVWTEAVGKHAEHDPAMMSVVNALVDAGADLQMKSLHLNGKQRLQVGWYLNKRPVLQERVALMEAADEAMAEAPEPAPSRARARL